MISLDVATDRLLHRVSYRQAFLDGCYDELDLSAEDLAALQQIDRQQLIETADSVRAFVAAYSAKTLTRQQMS